MTIRTVPILETTDPAILSRLAATKRGRRLMGRSLSTRTVIVDGRRLDQLIRRLTEQEGMPPQIAQQNEPADPIVASTGKPVKQLPTNHAAHLWQAARVYQMLGRYINLPSRFPADLFEALTNQVDPIAKAAAEAAVDQVVEALEAALTGRVAYPPWPEEGLPIEQSLSVIEQALAESALIEIDYYALSTETITRRTVEPYRVEWWHKKNKRIQPSAGATHSPAGIDIESHAQGISLAGSDQVAASPEHRVSRETPYLVGFCHRAQAERLFRLDRIRRIALLAGADD
jgi:hypothetical protein